MRPAKIPMNAFWIFPNAAGTCETSTPEYIATAPVDSRVVIMSHETSPARAGVPSVSSAMPIATPIAKSKGIWSIIALAALMQNAA